MGRNCLKVFFLLANILLLTSCVKTAKVDLPSTEPVRKATQYSSPLRNLGKLSREISSELVTMTAPGIQDDTGASSFTSAEIPLDITEMLVSSINKIGGKVRYITYDPAFVSNLKATSVGGNLPNHIVPDYLIKGGITEFDRSLVTSGTGGQLGFSVGGKDEFGADASVQDKDSTSSISMDLNVALTHTMALVSRVSAVNTIKVHKGLSDHKFGIQFLTASFGLNNSVKKVQGRHAAVRMLVEYSTLELVGKLMRLPYWKCIPGASPDEEYIETLKEEFDFVWNDQKKIAHIQRLLPSYGFPEVKVTGKLDAPTMNALSKVCHSYNFSCKYLNSELFALLFRNAPVLGEKSKINNVSNSASLGLKPIPLADTRIKTVQKPKLNVVVMSSKAHYKKGESLKFAFKGNRNFYGLLLMVSASGETIQLLPNPYRDRQFFESNKEYVVPSKQDPFNLQAWPPLGREELVLYASTKPLPTVPFMRNNNGLLMLEGSMETLHSFFLEHNPNLVVKRYAFTTGE